MSDTVHHKEILFFFFQGIINKNEIHWNKDGKRDHTKVHPHTHTAEHIDGQSQITDNAINMKNDKRKNGIGGLWVGVGARER